ncbi:MAG TPA: hypothetical protein VFL41_13240 [Gaiellaceae bacterium]|nr:hypothetical protein [Gaiellaceae bacterium]
MPRLKLATMFALAASSLALAAPARADLDAGAVDDRPLGTADGGAAFFALMNDVGLKEVRLTIRWDPDDPATIANEAEVAAALPVATLRGVKVVFSVQPLQARSITGRRGAPGEFALFLQRIARSFPTVKDFIVGNEPNHSRFWQPQYDSRGRSAAPAAYFELLARSYDALKAVDPTINVIGLALSARGNDAPSAHGNISHSPVKFLRGLGAAYRASGRRRPLMDSFAFHPYPRKDRDPLMKGYEWPNAGMPNLGRVKQAFWDAFHGTAQRTFEQGLKMKLDEVGWQVAVIPGTEGSYFGAESVEPTDEATQAVIYASLLGFAACDPSVESVLFFGFEDEPDLDRWQAGLVRADGTPRPSYEAVKQTLAQTGGRCARRMRRWRHSTTLEGASAVFPRVRRLPSRVYSWSLLARAEEDARFEAGIYRFNGRRGARVLATNGRLDARTTRLVRFPARLLRPGRYVCSIRFRAAMNPSRILRRTSRPFTIYSAR